MNKKTSFLVVLSTLILAACQGSMGDAGVNGTVETYTLGNGPVMIEEFSDFECPACGMIAPMVKRYAEENPDKVTLEYNHFPLTRHQQALPAAIAAECAGAEGKFWEYKGLLFEGQEKLGDEFYLEAAKELSLNEANFKTCLEDDAVKKKVLLSSQEGQRRGVNATPTFFVSVEGEEPVKVNFDENFFNFIEQKAKEVGSSAAPVVAE